MPAKKVWKPFEEAREFARSLQLNASREWYGYCKSGEKPDDIPVSPKDVYKNDGWKDWFDWLGTDREWRPFEEAREFARSLKLRGQEEWYQYAKTDEKPNDIPEHPNDVYNNDWKGMIDWLGNEWRPFKEAREFARSLQLKAWIEWIEYCKSNKKPNYIPSNPDKLYKNDWISWTDWLGNEELA